MGRNSQVFVSLGGNLGNLRANLARARTKIAELDCTDLESASAQRLTEPVGVVGQPEFLNQVLRLSTGLEPQALLDCLLEIEKGMGRVRTSRWGPRIIDLDILFYGALRLETPSLVLPHPEVWVRPFFLDMIGELDSTFLQEWEEFRGERG